MHIEIRFQMRGGLKVWHTQRGKDAHIFTGLKKLLLPELHGAFTATFSETLQTPLTPPNPA
jgi:hypothetical protein